MAQATPDAPKLKDCPVCEGSGEVDCACTDEPDGDYLYEQARDRRIEQ